MSLKKNQALTIGARQINNGISIHVDGRRFTIEYPRSIWLKTPLLIRQFLAENLAFGQTHFLPLIFNQKRINYKMALPAFEIFFFKNHLCDLLDTERVDGAPFLSYLRNFYNLEYNFQPRLSSLPIKKDIPVFHPSQPNAVIPFSFGKESLATLGLCLELGIKPILVYFEDPIEKYEKPYKLGLIREFAQKFKLKVYFVKNQAGLLRCGAAFGKHSDLGWGVQTTVLNLMLVPFVFAFCANYIFFGSEYANNEFESFKGWKLFHSYDQTTYWTKQQSNMIRLLTNNQCQVNSSLEPIEEINIFSLLHYRYPGHGKYQFSCRAEKPLFNHSQWCHACYKCARMFLFALALNVNPNQIGFRKNLLIPRMFHDYLGSGLESGSSQELDFAFYVLARRKFKSPQVALFAKKRLPHLKPWNWYRKYYNSLKPEQNLPEVYRGKIKSIFKEELKRFDKIISCTTYSPPKI